MLMDTTKLSLPPADLDPGLTDWLKYLETVRPFVEAEYLTGRPRAEKKMIKLGGWSPSTQPWRRS